MTCPFYETQNKITNLVRIVTCGLFYFSLHVTVLARLVTRFVTTFVLKTTLIKIFIMWYWWAQHFLFFTTRHYGQRRSRNVDVILNIAGSLLYWKYKKNVSCKGSHPKNAFFWHCPKGVVGSTGIQKFWGSFVFPLVWPSFGH